MAARNSGNRRRLIFGSGSRRTDTKGQPARQLIRSAGARLFFLPPYSPDLNPIEMMFAKLKTLLRKADERSVEGNMAKGRLTPRRFLLRSAPHTSVTQAMI
ncbi:hypothetical protein AcidC75_18480 [Acidisoma sp. C75]